MISELEQLIDNNKKYIIPVLGDNQLKFDIDKIACIKEYKKNRKVLKPLRKLLDKYDVKYIFDKSEPYIIGNTIDMNRHCLYELRFVLTEHHNGKTKSYVKLSVLNQQISMEYGLSNFDTTIKKLKNISVDEVVEELLMYINQILITNNSKLINNFSNLIK